MQYVCCLFTRWGVQLSIYKKRASGSRACIFRVHVVIILACIMGEKRNVKHHEPAVATAPNLCCHSSRHVHSAFHLVTHSHPAKLLECRVRIIDCQPLAFALTVKATRMF